VLEAELVPDRLDLDARVGYARRWRFGPPEQLNRAV